MASSVDVHMRETDAFSWTMEKDPALRMTVVALAVLDGVPDWDEVVRRMGRLAQAVPMFRQRVVQTPVGLAPPKWVVYDRFDLDWHVRRIAAPPPGDLDSLLELAAKLGIEAFDPERPLWTAWLVEGLADGGAAWIAKVHHTLTDGIGGMELLTHVFDVDGISLAGGPPASAVAAGLGVGARSMVGSALRHDVVQAVTAARGGVAGVVRTALAAGRGPRAAVAGAVSTWRSLLEAIEPTGEKLSTVMTARGLRRRFGTLDVPLDVLRAAGKTADGTVNDAFLAAVTGGLRRYHVLHQAPATALRVTLPISIRQPGDATGGNRIALIRMELPVDVADPVVRMHEIRGRVERWKSAPGLAYMEAAYAVVNHLPASYLQGLAKHVDFVASNVPGFPVRVQLAGPRLVAFYAFGPTGGTAVNVTMMSYAGAVHVGVDADADAVPDFDAFMTCMRAGFAEVSACGVSPAARRHGRSARAVRV